MCGLFFNLIKFILKSTFLSTLLIGSEYNLIIPNPMIILSIGYLYAKQRNQKELFHLLLICHFKTLSIGIIPCVPVIGTPHQLAISSYGIGIITANREFLITFYPEISFNSSIG